MKQGRAARFTGERCSRARRRLVGGAARAAVLCLGALVGPGLPVVGQGPASVLATAAGLPDVAFAGLSQAMVSAAQQAVSCARARGVVARHDVLTLIDYSLPSTEPRLWVLDLEHNKVLYHELVAHGSGSGENLAVRFSNEKDSRATSLGLYLTGATYEGVHGYSMKLQGLEPGRNDAAERRNIVLHGAWYVSADQIRQYGRLGRSWGCPAVSEAVAGPIIDVIKDGSFLYAYASDDSEGGAVAPAAECAVAASTH
jgi:hypothetical protein